MPTSGWGEIGEVGKKLNGKVMVKIAVKRAILGKRSWEISRPLLVARDVGLVDIFS